MEFLLSKLWVTKIIQLYLFIVRFLEKVGLPLLIFSIRLWMAKIFWYSGLTKISNWQSTVWLFENEYKVPIINPEIAAYFATSFEFICPILLVTGLLSRLACLPMLAMVAVIQFTYLDLIDHRYWAFLLTVILFYGPGCLSLDNFIFNKIISKK